MSNVGLHIGNWAAWAGQGDDQFSVESEVVGNLPWLWESGTEDRHARIVCVQLYQLHGSIRAQECICCNPQRQICKIV